MAWDELGARGDRALNARQCAERRDRSTLKSCRTVAPRRERMKRMNGSASENTESGRDVARTPIRLRGRVLILPQNAVFRGRTRAIRARIDAPTDKGRRIATPRRPARENRKIDQ